jgi:hypothetical protein
MIHKGRGHVFWSSGSNNEFSLFLSIINDDFRMHVAKPMQFDQINAPRSLAPRGNNFVMSIRAACSILNDSTVFPPPSSASFLARAVENLLVLPSVTWLLLRAFTVETVRPLASAGNAN